MSVCTFAFITFQVLGSTREETFCLHSLFCYSKEAQDAERKLSRPLACQTFLKDYSSSKYVRPHNNHSYGKFVFSAHKIVTTIYCYYHIAQMCINSSIVKFLEQIQQAFSLRSCPKMMSCKQSSLQQSLGIGVPLLFNWLRFLGGRCLLSVIVFLETLFNLFNLNFEIILLINQSWPLFAQLVYSVMSHREKIISATTVYQNFQTSDNLHHI